MPELPEVETVRRSLEGLVVGQTILTVEVREPRLRKPVAPDFAVTLIGRTIQQIQRRGKYLHFCLDDGRVWVVHLGMTGELLVADRTVVAVPHDHVFIVFTSDRSLRYNDPRRFGLMAVGSADEVAVWTALGVEPLSAAFSAAYLWAAARATRRTIKDVLMDQHVIAGIGNIYASELLFRAGVRPACPAVTLSRQRAERIVKATKTVLREAIRHRGSSISDYLDGEGRPGEFQQRFRVYDREGKPCLVCAKPIRRETRGGRSAFFCPHCQR